MTDCGVCLNDGDFDAPEFYNESIVKARKQHKCYECNRIIDIGKQYQRVTGKWDSSVDTFCTCLDCMNIREAFRCGGSFLFGELWTTLRESQERINTGCLERIRTPSAKEYYLERLREMRGIA